MRKNTLRAAFTLCAVASLAAATGPVSSASAAAHTAPAARHAPRPVLVDCLFHPQVRPADFILACGDGNSRLSSLHWKQWDTGVAVAEGVNAVNDCKPYCAAGHFHSYAVTVRLDRPKAWKKHPQTQHYTRMTLTYSDGRPSGFDRVVTYPLWD
ncbi:hypothetical protein C3489_34135 [Streptomyces sp. Ru71]|uniref:hypothetical protein n=1 Tax=Streptomyces sp. Ru71 TaxID=2080746 RepID=UPI000CDE2A2B|nr:hypothetical protein [Streptomyces sp. Ru71]POX45459.1 hypothetical protein C3489_34135 [Streptomyces sp. Ru71]